MRRMRDQPATAHPERKGKGWQFIAMGIGFAVTFVVTLVVIVQAILATTG